MPSSFLTGGKPVVQTPNFLCRLQLAYKEQAVRLVLPFLNMRQFKTALPDRLHIYGMHLGNVIRLVALLSLSLLEICPPLYTLPPISPIPCSLP